MNNSNSKKRGVMAHIGVYTILIAMLAGINVLASTDVWWFLYPALIWGAGLAFHLLYRLPLYKLKPKWRKFFRHLGAYIIIIIALAGINIISSTAVLWFFYPALIWGAALALHFHFGIVFAKAENKIETGRFRARERRAIQQRSARRPVRTVRLANKTLRGHLNMALAYKTQIDRLVRTTSNQHARARLQDLTLQVDEWLEAIKDLAQQVDRFRGDALIRKDLETVPRSIRDLEARLARETNAANRAELKRILLNRRKQLAALEQLRQIARRAEIQIESTLSSLGTIYSQALASQSASHIADYSHLSAEVDEEVHLLQDRLEALKEVKLSSMYN